ncbi:alginate O-acetyltransferase AlgX-related protein [Deinococcus sonorensis]
MTFGTDGWMFEPWEFNDTFSFSATAALQELNEAFRARGSTLVLVPVPSRPYKYLSKIDPTLYPNLKFSPETYKQSWQTMIQAARATGVTVVDLLPSVENYSTSETGEEFFYPRDHHWTTSGVQVIAPVVAQAISALKLPGLNKLTVKMDGFSLKKEGFNSGAFADRYTKACGSRAASSPAYKVRYTKQTGLLDDTVATIGVFGDSFGLAYPDNNFAPLLEWNTKLNTVNYSLAGGGSLGALTGYLADPAVNHSLPQVVVVPFMGAVPNDANQYRQITATLRGCPGPVQAVQSAAEAAVTFQADGAAHSAVHLAFTQDTQKVKLTLDYQDGTSEKMTLNRSNADYFKGDRRNFYVSLPADRTVKDLQVSTDHAMNPQDSVSLCKR